MSVWNQVDVIAILATMLQDDSACNSARQHLTKIYWTFYVPETLYGGPAFTMDPGYEL
jgi:hypothetical protein